MFNGIQQTVFIAEVLPAEAYDIIKNAEEQGYFVERLFHNAMTNGSYDILFRLYHNKAEQDDDDDLVLMILPD